MKGHLCRVSRLFFQSRACSLSESNSQSSQSLTLKAPKASTSDCFFSVSLSFMPYVVVLICNTTSSQRQPSVGESVVFISLFSYSDNEVSARPGEVERLFQVVLRHLNPCFRLGVVVQRFSFGVAVECLLQVA